MPKVRITPNSAYDPLGVRILLSNLGVQGPMLQDAKTITCMMTEAEINSFRNGRGAAHGLEIIPDPAPAQSTTPILDEPQSADEPNGSDAAAPEPPEFPKTYGKAGQKRVIVANADAEREAIAAGYKHVIPDPLNAV